MAGKEQMDLRASLADPKPQTLAEINRSILNSYYTFKLGSPLKNIFLRKHLITAKATLWPKY